MKKEIYHLMILLLVMGILVTTTSCTSDEGQSDYVTQSESEGQSDYEGQSDSEELNESESNSTQLTQQQIEKMAILSLTNIEVDEHFLFTTQRMVSIDLRFANEQLATDILIYSDFDLRTQSPINLLEKGVLNNSSRYRGMVSVDSSIDSLIVVIGGSLQTVTEIVINSADRINYLFEE